MAPRPGPLVVLLLGAFSFLSQAAVSIPGHASGLREAAAKRGADLARAPDGSIATDAPLPTLHAHTGVRSAADLNRNSLSATSEATDAVTGSVIDAATSTPSVSLWLLLAMTMVMALLSGVGALPYLFTGKLEPYWSGIANAVGCGVMLAASFDLLEESKTFSAPLVLGGILLGVLAMAYSQSWLSRFEDVTFSDLQGADARKAMLIIGVMAAHAFGEGSGVGVSFSGPRGWAQGLLVTIAIGLHNIPEGMAVATIMVARGTPPRTALFWTLLSALPQGIVAVPAYMFVETFTGLLPIALGFAAGCMIWIVFAELIPDALETAEHGHVATAATLSAAALQCISMVIAQLERPDGSLASPITADVSLLLPDLLLLLPGFLVPCVAAGLTGSLLPSLPFSMGLSVGTTLWTGLGGLTTALLSHHRSSSQLQLPGYDDADHHHHYHHHPYVLGKHAAVLWAAAGALTCAVLWRGLGTVSLSAVAAAADQGVGSSKDAEEGLTTRAEHEGFPPLELIFGAPGRHYHHSDEKLQQLQQQAVALQFATEGGGAAAVAPIGGGVHGNGGGGGVAYYGMGPQGMGPSPYMNGHGGGGGGVTTVHATGVAAGRGGGLCGGGLERRNGYGYGGGVSSSSHAASEDGGGGGGGAGVGWSQKSFVGHPLQHCQQGKECGCRDSEAKLAVTCGRATLDGGMPLDGSVADRPRECVRAALAVGAMLLVAAVPLAYDVAEVMLRHLGDAAMLLPPLFLRGIAPGVACVGIVRAVAGTTGWRLPAAAAGLLSTCLTLTVSLLLLPLPYGRAASEDISLDPAGLAERLRAFASGGLMLAALGYLWPAAAHFKPRKVQQGVSLGLGLGLLPALLHAGLCAWTPYCLAPGAAAAPAEAR